MRITVSLPSELVERVDRHARTHGVTRSAVITEWLRAGARHRASAALDAEISAYYAGLTAEEARDNEMIARAGLQAGRRLDYGDPARADHRSRRRKTA